MNQRILLQHNVFLLEVRRFLFFEVVDEIVFDNDGDDLGIGVVGEVSCYFERYSLLVVGGCFFAIE